MFKSSLLKQASRTSTTVFRPPNFIAATRAKRIPTRAFSRAIIRRDKAPDNLEELTTAGEPGASEHEGKFARTDENITFEHPEEHQLPSSAPVQGRGGFHFKRTLASFSMESRVGLVTGGARGLGLVMSQALHLSGADVAIVDLNSMCAPGSWHVVADMAFARGGSREASSESHG